MPLSSPACLTGKAPHCETCLNTSQPTCCECGEALVPWHPEIYGIYLDNGWDWIMNSA